MYQENVFYANIFTACLLADGFRADILSFSVQFSAGDCQNFAFTMSMIWNLENYTAYLVHMYLV